MVPDQDDQDQSLVPHQDQPMVPDQGKLVTGSSRPGLVYGSRPGKVLSYGTGTTVFKKYLFPNPAFNQFLSATFLHIALFYNEIHIQQLEDSGIICIYNKVESIVLSGPPSCVNKICESSQKVF